MDDLERIAKEFDLGAPIDPPEPVARGANGVVWRLDTDRGVFAVKLLQPWVEDEPRPFDVDVQQAAIADGIPMPAPVLTPDGRAMVDRVRVYEWVDVGAPWEPPVGVDLAAEAGAILGRVHRLGVAPKDPVAPWFTTPPTLDRWNAVASRAEAAGLPLAAELASEAGYLAEVGASLRPLVDEPITCHRDFVPSNVLPSERGPVVLDWENVGPLTAAAELAWALLWWTTDDRQTDSDAARALVAGYGDAPTIDRSAFAPVLATHLNYLLVSAHNVINDDEHSEFAFAAFERLRPQRLRLRLAAVDEILSAVAP